MLTPLLNNTYKPDIKPLSANIYWCLRDKTIRELDYNFFRFFDDKIGFAIYIATPKSFLDNWGISSLIKWKVKYIL